MSVEEAKHTALERAKIQAIADEFGTIVSQSTSTIVSNKNGESDTQFFSTGGSDVKGEWIETIGEPKYEISYDGGMLQVSVKVSGKIRDIRKPKNEISAKILRNGVEEQYESSEFYEGDQMYLSFASATNGNLLVYLLDNKNNAYRLLPYRRQTEPSIKIEDAERQIFFCKKSVELALRRIVDEYVLTASQPYEINTIYVIFTPNELFKALDYQIDKELPRELSCADFHKWLAMARKQDENIIVKEIPLTIYKQK